MLSIMAVVAVLVALNAALACVNTLRLRHTLDLVAHTREVLGALDHALVTATEAETQQRGFLITRDDAFLDRYREARAEAGETETLLDSLVRDNDEQVSRATALHGHLDTRFAVLDEGITAIRELGFEEASRMVMTGRGTDAMEAARTTVERMRQAEEILLGARVRDAETSRAMAIGSAVAAGLVALFALGALARLLRRQIRERTIAADNLHAEKELFRTTLASIGDGVITTDTSGRVTFLNHVAESLTGWTAAQAGAQPLETVFHIVNEDTGERVENPALRALREGLVVALSNHTVLRTRRGEARPVDDSAAPIRVAGGAIVGAVLVFRDVTQRREAERAIREADQRKDRFLALLAHELRNPLAPMRNSLEVMRLATDPEQVGQMRGVMERQLAHMVRLVDDLLDVSRIASDKQHLRLQTVEIGTVLASALETFRPVLAQSGQQLVTTEPDRPVHVRADPVRLAQVLYNLLNNASKFSLPGSRILLEATRQGDRLLLRVRDEGAGIPPEMLERIFEMFVQVDQSLERSRSGLGVGLSLVRRLVELHGGSVSAHSDGPGRGSEFVVTLPVAEPAPAAPASP
ncbi:MAG TPA: CHASE3 domain-containing protein, partial [Planctomycetota bacterium]|nr:CHASE3 domain-containing protein [Planctomycetota bacterium]